MTIENKTMFFSPRYIIICFGPGWTEGSSLIHFARIRTEMRLQEVDVLPFLRDASGKYVKNPEFLDVDNM